MQEGDEAEKDNDMNDENLDDYDMNDSLDVIVYLFENKGGSKGGSDRQLTSSLLRLIQLVYSFPWYLQYNYSYHC